MLIAYDYPLLGFFWSMLYFYLFFVFIMALFHVFGDIFRSHDMGGVAKAFWVIFVILLPFLGVIVYLVARGDEMAKHAISDAEARDAAFRSQVQQAAGTSSPAEELTKLAALRDSGAITPQDFEAAKAKVLS